MMATGPGKYDELATMVRESTKAKGVLLIVFEGHLGSGFSMQMLGINETMLIPSMLRDIADQIEEDMKTGYKGEPNDSGTN
jgi:hypothetical protein